MGVRIRPQAPRTGQEFNGFVLLIFAKVMEPRAFFYIPPHPPLSPILGERIKVRGQELSIRRSIIYVSTNYKECLDRRFHDERVSWEVAQGGSF
ncbi:MAG: hypothetical protein A2157_07310 [Deltaproteobacteria bacterium RBG_16_47_11]|nr:MAG: hypothetical protein A2157_07310 [Deltaproteobacteria bacterium RBG_16_47_11]